MTSFDFWVENYRIQGGGGGKGFLHFDRSDQNIGTRCVIFRHTKSQSGIVKCDACSVIF